MSTLLQAKERTEFKHSALTGLRQSGGIPGVVYGTKTTNTSIYLDEADFLKVMKAVGRNGVIELDVEGQKHNVVLNDYDSDPIKRKILHVDFLAVDLSQAITATVKVSLIGDAQGVKDGGVLQQALHEVEVTAKPNDIPAAIEISIDELHVGDTLTIADIKGYNGVDINHEEEEVIASILAPRQEEEISTGEQQEGGVPDNLEGRETVKEEIE
ncbi:50S ribosomal protein L25/general stress protein Ctc [Niallia sp. NCCP-28]|uniref:50S ribosomal protein L25/general stress protein Ctc n=1 Tax=Niallia sp. NCCP-28 TaxID=2934712 RepID=UPI0020809551|nr:50S ribosomal protein L25/general stress protein Ctc [Niallia sp. NCCP-28]GKU85018.1 general stress protein CTC [Niallia sp. NCCP-28]